MTNVLNIREQFNLAAREYDAGRRKFIPCFDEFYEKTTDFAATFVRHPQTIVDLGAGTGLLSMYFFKHFPQSQYILADAAEEMLTVARKRFAHAVNVQYAVLDYTAELPAADFDLVISALSIHHLENEQKESLFREIHQRLQPGKWFINYDQFCGSTPEMSKNLDKFWISHLQHSGLTDDELTRWRERQKLDRECPVEEEIRMLHTSGFQTVECIYRNQKFAVIAAQA